MDWDTHFSFLENLSIKRDENDKIEISPFGETSVEGIYIAGETKDNFAGQLIDAASNGGMVAKMMMMTQINEEIGRAHAELQSRFELVCRLLLEKKEGR